MNINEVNIFDRILIKFSEDGILIEAFVKEISFSKKYLRLYINIPGKDENKFFDQWYTPDQIILIENLTKGEKDSKEAERKKKELGVEEK